MQVRAIGDRFILDEKTSAGICLRMFFCYSVNLVYGRGNWKVRTRKMAMEERMTGLVGQKLPPPQPPVIPSEASCTIQGAVGEVTGTSLKPVLEPTAGGT